MLQTLINLVEETKSLNRKYRIGDIIEHRPDGSVIYMSIDGVLNLDDRRDLEEARRKDGIED